MNNSSLISSNLISNEPVTVESLLKLAHTIDLFEQYMRPHANQIARMAEALALRIGISATDLNALKIAALMHDIGEMIMNSPALRKGGKLDFKHKIELWRHPIIGEQQLAKRELPRQAQLLVRWHHEWWNGSGYPDMLTKEMIPIGARILRLVDTYDALTANRPYREAFSSQEAQKIIERSAGIEFDPYLVKVFLEMLAEMSTPIMPKPTRTISTKPVQAFEEDLPSEIIQTKIEDNPAISTTIENLENLENFDSLEVAITPDSPTISATEELAHNSNDLIVSASEELADLEPSNNNIHTDIIESKPLVTQPLFTPSSKLTYDLLDTSYLSEPLRTESSENSSSENGNDLLTKPEENLLDKSQENAENKSE
ncbi:MAG: HD-GYP domain-containing protein [bacterium]|nr:MAG: HD-GYP domain-containing protein [bacterium]